MTLRTLAGGGFKTASGRAFADCGTASREMRGYTSGSPLAEVTLVGDGGHQWRLWP